MVSLLTQLMFAKRSFLKGTLKEVIFCCVIAGLLLISCAPAQTVTGNGIETSDVQPRKGKLSADFTLEELREIAAETQNTTTIENAEVSAIKTMKRDYKDINPKMLLFEERVSSEDERFDRLENAVQGIHDDLAEITPGINRLLTIEEDIRDLHAKLSVMVDGGTISNVSTTGTTSSTPAVASSSNNRPEPRKLSLKGSSSTPTETVSEEITEEYLPSINLEPQMEAEEIISETNAPQPAEAIQSQQPSSPLTVRAWESAGKTRIVFETPTKQDYSISFNKNAGEVIVETKVTMSSDQVATLSQMSNQIAGINITANPAGGTRLIINISEVETISDGYYLPPSAADSDHRYYFDMFK